MTYRISDSELLRAPSRRLGLALCVIAAVAAAPLAPNVAHAAPSAAEKETARNLVKSARGKLRRGEIAAALEDLKAAHAIMNVPTTGLELGKAQVEAGQLVEARDTLLAVVRLPAAKIEPFAFRRARAEAKKLSDQVAKRIPTLRIQIVGKNAAGASVTIDGVEVAQAALQSPLSLNPGPHVVTLSKGGAERTTDVELSEAQTRDLVLDASGLVLPKVAKVEPAPAKPKTRTNPLVWLGFGVAGAGTLVGSVTGILAISKHSDVVGRCTDNRCPPETHDDIESGERLANISTVSFAVAAVGAGVGVWGLLNPKAAPAEPEVGVWLGPTSVGVRGKF